MTAVAPCCASVSEATPARRSDRLNWAQLLARLLRLDVIGILVIWCATAHAALPTGRNVIVGIVDNALNWRHEAFRDPRDPNRSRVLYFRDADGREWDRVAIEAALRGDGDSPPLDGDGHGTAVAGVAAGSAIPGGRMQGTAPEADIIFVSDRLADGADYIFEKAEALGRRAVVNFSVLSFDWVVEVERFSGILTADDRRITVAGAGNIPLGDDVGLHWGEIILGESPTFTAFSSADISLLKILKILVQIRLWSGGSWESRCWLQMDPRWSWA